MTTEEEVDTTLYHQKFVYSVIFRTQEEAQIHDPGLLGPLSANDILTSERWQGLEIKVLQPEEKLVVLETSKDFKFARVLTENGKIGWFRLQGTLKK